MGETKKKMDTKKIIAIILMVFGFAIIAVPGLANTLTGGLVGSITGDLSEKRTSDYRSQISSDTIIVDYDLQLRTGLYTNICNAISNGELAARQRNAFGSVYIEQNGEKHLVTTFQEHLFNDPVRGTCTASELYPQYTDFDFAKETIINYDELRGISGRAELLIGTSDSEGASFSERVRYEIWIDDPACQLGDGTLMASQDFTAGTTVDISTFRHEPIAFCSSPPILVLEGGKTVEQKISEYDLLLTGSHITIPEGQVWRFSYVFDDLTGIPVICDTDMVYDIGEESCVEVGFVHFCSEGISDDVSKSCITQASSKAKCGIGVFDTAKDKCVYISPAGETDPIVPLDSTVVINSRGDTTFEFDGEEGLVCDSGSLNADKTACTKPATTEIGRVELTGKEIFGADFPVTRIALGTIFILFGGLLFFRG